MKVRTVFEDGKATIVLTPEGEWEQKLLGAVANGGNHLDANVRYESEGHFTYGKCRLVQITLTEPQTVAAESPRSPSAV